MVSSLKGSQVVTVAGWQLEPKAVGEAGSSAAAGVESDCG